KAWGRSPLFDRLTQCLLILCHHLSFQTIYQKEANKTSGGPMPSLQPYHPTKTCLKIASPHQTLTKNRETKLRLMNFAHRLFGSKGILSLNLRNDPYSMK